MKHNKTSPISQAFGFILPCSHSRSAWLRRYAEQENYILHSSNNDIYTGNNSENITNNAKASRNNSEILQNNTKTLGNNGKTLYACAATSQKRTEYFGNLIWENNKLTILTENGYYSDGNYYFYIRNHVGSNAVVVNSGDNTAVQQNIYFPFGLIASPSTNQEAQPYKLTGKELNMDHGLMLYDFHARQYDLTIGRFTMVDPMAEKYPAISPYAYCLNNPLKVIDVDGRDIVILNAPNGAYGNGHMALLIGNQQKGWNYVSKDGSKWLPFWGPSKSSTPKNNKHKYSSLYDFDLSEDADINDGRYSQRLRFTTSEDEDNIALDAAVNSH